MFSQQALLENMKADHQTYGDGQHFLFFDSALDNALLKKYFELDEAPEYFPIFADHEHLLEISPYLVSISQSSQPFLDWWIHQCDQWGWLFYSTYSLEAQIDYWLSLVKINTPDLETHLLRYSDGSVANTLWDAFSTTERELFFQPCKSIHLQNSDKHWQRHVTNQNADNGNKLSYSLGQAWFSISQQVIDTISHTSSRLMRQNIIDGLWTHYPSILDTIPEPNIEWWVNLGMTQANANGIRSEQGTTLFVYMMFETRSLFFKADIFRRHFSNSQKNNNANPNSGENMLADIANSLSHKQWEDIRYQHPAPF